MNWKPRTPRSWSICGLLALALCELPLGGAQGQTATDVICNGCVHGGDIAGFTVSAGKLSVNSVTNPKIATSAVTQGKIANGAVTGPKIGNFAVSAGKLTSNSVTNPKIATGAVTQGKLATGAVTSAKIANQTITAADIAANSVGGGRIADGTIAAADLASDAKPAGVDFVTAAPSGIFLAESGGADTIVASVTITAPAAGAVIVNANGWFDFNSAAGHARCSVTTGDFVQSTSAIRSRVEPFATPLFVPVARTRVFPLAGPGSVTYKLVCDKQSGTVDINDVTLSALYVPQTY